MTYSDASGLVNSDNSFNFTLGYAEARVFIPSSSSGQPVDMPAFWTDGQSWPTDGENDIIEVLNGCGSTGPGLGYDFHNALGTSASAHR